MIKIHPFNNKIVPLKPIDMLKNTLFFVLVIAAFSACRKDLDILKEAGTLSFSKDTVYFDTVFTRLVGSPYPRSVNKQFKIRNPYNKTVNINAQLMKGGSSEYRMNIDGETGTIIKDIEILPKDSAWVFVECTLEPNNLTNPALVRERIEFETNGNKQYVELAAYGWDAYYFKDTVLDKANENWILKDKPYVIVNICIVDENKTLTIGPGIHVYSTTNSYFIDTFGKKNSVNSLNVLGTLKINGTKAEPVIFEGDRLDNNFANVAGQWQGIGFFVTSKDNEITHAIIKNATVGIRIDSLSNNTNPKLKISKTIIKTMSGIGIWGRTGDVEVENTVVSNCGIATFYGQYGGKYLFTHCTFSNASASSRDPHFVVSNQQRDDNKVVIKTYALGVGFTNNIIWGNNESEFGTDLSASLPANAFTNCLIKQKTPFGTTNIFNRNPLFENAGASICKIKTGSPAINAGASTPITSDIEDKTRTGIADIGAYEF